MKIKYKKRHLNFNLFLGIGWLIIGLLGVLTKEKTYWTDYAFIVLSIIYLIMYFYKKNNGYLIINIGIIRVNALFGKKINLAEIKVIKKFAGDYILKTEKTDLIINTQIIDPNSLAELKTELDKLNISC